MEQRWGVSLQTKIRRKIRFAWVRPPEGTAKLNLGGSLRNKIRSLGAAIKNHEGQVLRLAHGYPPYLTIDEIKVDALHQTMLMAEKKGFRKILINIDSAIVIHDLKMDSSPWGIRHQNLEFISN